MLHMGIHPPPLFSLSHVVAQLPPHLWVHGAVVRVRFTTADVRAAVLRGGNNTVLRQTRASQDKTERTSHDQAVKRQGPQPLPLLFGHKRRLTSKHAHRLGPPTLQSWHWPWKTADSRFKAAHLLKKRSQIRKGEVRPWTEIQRFVISFLWLTFTPMLAPQAWNRIQLKSLY